MSVENLTPVEAASVLICSVFGEDYFSDEILKKLHQRRPWDSNPNSTTHWESLFQDVQKSQLLVDTVNNVLNGEQNMFWQLTEREATVLRLRFGLKDGQIKTLRETGEQMGGLSAERARQIEAEALQKLRYPDVRDIWKPFLPETGGIHTFVSKL